MIKIENVKHCPYYGQELKGENNGYCVASMPVY